MSLYSPDLRRDEDPVDGYPSVEDPPEPEPTPKRRKQRNAPPPPGLGHLLVLLWFLLVCILPVLILFYH